MSIFKVVHRKNRDDCVMLSQRINYILNPLATKKGLIYGQYISTHYPYEEMIYAKTCFPPSPTSPRDSLEGKAFYEYLISLAPEDGYPINQFFQCMACINQYFSNYGGNHYQVVHSLHINTDHLHAHFIANNTDFLTGKRFRSTRSSFCTMIRDINKILTDFGFSGIPQYHWEKYGSYSI